jgi:signal peptidase I
MFKKLKERTPRLIQNKLKLYLYVVLCVAIVLSLTVLPVYMWMASDIKTRGVTSIRGDSMSPTIYDSNILYVQPVRFERGEIVVARCPDSSKYKSLSNVAILKRIVGLPGETIEITAEGVCVNGALLEEDYTANQELTLKDDNDINEIVLSSNEYFLLGDNRDNSFDSRHVGAVPMSNFLYGLTLEPNDYTHKILGNMAIVAIGNLLLIIVLPILLFISITCENQDGEIKKLKEKKADEIISNTHDVPVKSDDAQKPGTPQPKSVKNCKKAKRKLKAHKNSHKRD